jgi:Tol biopolymer transport system component
VLAGVALAAGVGGAALVLALGLGPGPDRAAAPSAPVRRYEVTGVTSTGNGITTISPDGQWIAWTEGFRDDTLRVRRMDSYEHRVIPDSAGGVWPCFSPDSRSLAFFVHGRGLLRVALEPGSAVQTITSEAGVGTSAWGPDGTIVFDGGVLDGASHTGLMRVDARGGRPQVLTTWMTRSAADAAVTLPPDGRTVLFRHLGHLLRRGRVSRRAGGGRSWSRGA